MTSYGVLQSLVEPSKSEEDLMFVAFSSSLVHSSARYYLDGKHEDRTFRKGLLIPVQLLSHVGIRSAKIPNRRYKIKKSPRLLGVSEVATIGLLGTNSYTVEAPHIPVNL